MPDPLKAPAVEKVFGSVDGTVSGKGVEDDEECLGTFCYFLSHSGKKELTLFSP
jgi:hypothetical protein